MDSVGKKHSGETFAEVWQRLNSSKSAGEAPQVVDASLEAESKEEKALPTLRGRLGTYRSSSVQRTSSAHLRLDRLSGIDEGDLAEESAASTPRNGEEHENPFAGSGTLSSPGGSMRLLRSSSGARNRWRRLRHTVQFAAHMTQLRQGAADLLEENANEALHSQNSTKDNAGVTGAAAFDGEKTAATRRPRGRKGMEGMLVRHDKSFLTMLQDFYVACLKMPMGRFLLGVFLAPVALGLLFTPLFLMDMGGLSFDGTTLAATVAGEGSVAAATRRFSAMLNVFLYALSLSTTFGGSPVVALSPFCLLVANVNTLMAQFLFVFLSGGVFARMSQPSHPVRCSKKAIIRGDDYVSTPGEEKNRVFAVRLVLTGPAPCELVDAKICLTFRIFVKLPSGSMFCSTQDLELVRPEVSYLRYGLMVRHIIDKKSPIFGHTMDTLKEGDASFSLTIMGLERTSMQPIFHLEDYFVCDGDVVWDGDYEDFIHINRQGQRVLDHSKIDSLKAFKVGGIVTQAISRMEADVAHRKEKEAQEKEKEALEKLKEVEAKLANNPPQSKGWMEGLRTRKLWKSKSTSFTRAPDW
ncbi:hypothetical protein M758_5G149700 [Ceratodon purpureus]|nr:hypothetical protein M758_5G149700 [Ceratodon purpureus]